MRINVLGVGFDNLTMAEAVDRGMELLGQEGAHYVVTPNPEIVEVCRENPEAMEVVNGADLVLADGIGVVKGAAMLGTPLKSRFYEFIQCRFVLNPYIPLDKGVGNGIGDPFARIGQGAVQVK